MNRTIFVAAVSLVLAGCFAKAVECQTAGGDLLAYYNGELVAIRLKPIPENASAALMTWWNRCFPEANPLSNYRDRSDGKRRGDESRESDGAFASRAPSTYR